MRLVEQLINKIGREKFYEFLRFCIVGTLAAGIHYGIYFLLYHYINVFVAYTIGYALSLVCNFFLTAYLTFRSTPTVGNSIGFGISHLINYLIHIFLLRFFLYIGIPKALAFFCVLAVAVPVNFLLLRLVFTHKWKRNNQSTQQ